MKTDLKVQYSACMRESLLKRARRRAARDDISLSRFIAEAVEARLRASRAIPEGELRNLKLCREHKIPEGPCGKCMTAVPCEFRRPQK